MKAQGFATGKGSPVARLLADLVGTACRFPALALALAALLAALSAYAAYTRLQYCTQRSDLVNPNKDHQKRWRRYVEEFGDDDDMVVVVKGTNPERMKQALTALAGEVEHRPEHFDRLFYKVDLRPLHNRALLFLTSEQIGQIQNNLQIMSMLLEPPLVGALDPLVGWKSLTLVRLMGEARSRAGNLIPGKPLSLADQQFLTQLRAISQAAIDYLEEPASYRSPWLSLLEQPPEQKDLLDQPQYFFSGDGTLAFLLACPVKEQGSFTAGRASVEAMQQIIASVAPAFPELEIGLTGLPVLENDEMVASQKDTRLASWLSLGGVALLYLLVFRALRYPLLIVVTLLVGTAWAMGWLTLTVGHLNILSATFVVMLIGMGDYGVLWVTRYQQNRSAGSDVQTALRHTATGGGPSILTAAAATALAFYAAMLADFQAVAELGWIAGSGVLLCAFSCFTVLPALLTLLERRRTGGAGPGGDSGSLKFPIQRSALHPARFLPARVWLPALAGRPRWVVATSAILTAVLAGCACLVHYDHNLLHLQARGLDSVKWEMTMVEHTAGASWHALSYTSTPEEALALKARYEQLPGVSRVVEVASLVPRDQRHKLAQLRDIQHRLRRLPERGAVIPHVVPRVKQLQIELDGLAEAIRPLTEAGSEPLLRGLGPSLLQLRDKLGAAPASRSAQRLRDFEQRLTGDLAEDLHRLRDVSTPLPITVDDLPGGLRTRYVGRTGKWLVRVFAKDCLWDHEPLRQFVEGIRTVDPEATGKPLATLEGLEALKKGFEWAGLYALAAIVLVFLADFRNLRHVFLALAPLAIGVVISLGIMGCFGITLNPATIIAFPLILGVGAVYGVHVVHDYLVRGAVDAARPYTLSYLIGRAVLVMALANMISFGTLAVSGHRGLAGLGFIIALGVACCMATALVFLPAVLRLVSTRRTAADQRQTHIRQRQAA